MLGNRLVAVGGYDGDQITAQVESLDLDSLTWVQLCDLPYRCSALTCSVLPLAGIQVGSYNAANYFNE